MLSLNIFLRSRFLQLADPGGDALACALLKGSGEGAVIFNSQLMQRGSQLKQFFRVRVTARAKSVTARATLFVAAISGVAVRGFLIIFVENLIS